MLPQFGKILITIGIVSVVLGTILMLSDRFAFFRIGRLPGDIVFRRGNITFYFPLVTSILLSLILTALLWFFGRK
ncbi:MAG: DUF2905 domain-containing protein [Acidobacteria bacterium]|nr:DUF2905 domain-containing protein [Acidobacteriota bacterium]